AAKNIRGKYASKAQELQARANFDAISRDSYMEKNIRFHQFIVMLSGNTRLQRVLSLLELPALRIYFPLVLDENTIAASSAEHQEIVRAICQGDASKASEVARQHVRRTAE